MGNLTTDLSTSEFACPCKYPDCKAHKKVAHMPLVLAIQAAADFFRKKYHATDISVDITCGNRCKKHDVDVQMKDAGKTRAEAEAMDSQHVSCIAADHRMYVHTGTSKMLVPTEELYEYYDTTYPNSCGVGYYTDKNGGRIHIDTRATRARWGKPK